MAKAFFGLLVVAALGVTGYYTYSYINHDGACCQSDTAAVKKSCCSHDAAAKTCCSESGDCTGACSMGDAKAGEEKKDGCCEGKEGGCCKDKKDEGKKE
jgi:hypothetical protein